MIQGFKATPKTKTLQPPLQPVDKIGRELGLSLAKTPSLINMGIIQNR